MSCLTRYTLILAAISILIFTAGCVEDDPVILDPPDPPAATGAIVVDLHPDDIGASWVLSGPSATNFHGSNDTILIEQPPGEYSIVWSDVELTHCIAPTGGTQILVADQTITFNGTYSGEIDLIVPPDEYPFLEPGNHHYRNVKIDGLLRLDSGSFTIRADTFLISSTGNLDGTIDFNDRRSRACDITIHAATVIIDGVLDADGDCFAVGYGMMFFYEHDEGGSITIIAESINVAGKISARGGSGICFSNEGDTDCTSGEDSGSIDFFTGQNLFVTGILDVKGGDGADLSIHCNYDHGRHGGHGGTITISPPTALPDATIDAQGGDGGSGIDGHPDGNPGVDGTVEGVL